MKFIGAMLFFVFAQQATAQVRAISCQYGETAAESLRVVDVNNQQVTFRAPDDGYGFKDFAGELREFRITPDSVKVVGRAKGHDAFVFLTVKADLKTRKIDIKQSEISEVLVTLDCRAIHLIF